MDRPAADEWGRGRAVAALAAVFAVLIMHGLSCMAGSAHTAGVAVAAAPSSAAHVASQVRAHHPCPECQAHVEVPAGGLQVGSGGQPMTASALAGGAEHLSGHGGAPCIAILTGLALLALLAAASATVGLPGPGANGAWLSPRPRPPTAVLRPSLSQLCVLRI